MSDTSIITIIYIPHSNLTNPSLVLTPVPPFGTLPPAPGAWSDP